MSCLTRPQKIFRRRKKLLRATKSLYAGTEPYRPYAPINAVLENWEPQLPTFLALFVPKIVLSAGPLRLRQRVVHTAMASMVREGILVAEDAAYGGAVPLPQAALKFWADEMSFTQSLRSRARFVASLLGHFREGLFKLSTLARSKVAAPIKPYVVAMGFSPVVWNSANAQDSGGGFLNWLYKSSPLAGTFEALLYCDKNTPDTEPAPILKTLEGQCASIPFPALQSPVQVGLFVAVGVGYAMLAGLLLLIGRWQAAVLLPDLIDLAYFSRLGRSQHAQAYIFTLGDQINRPLWTWAAEQQGSQVVFVYYASSYSLFHYHNTDVADEQRHPTTVGNLWSECWVQTAQVKDTMMRLLRHDPKVLVVGAFDMIDDASPLPSLPKRSVLVFDVGPSGQLLRLSEAGYICPYLTEDIILDFWRALATIARENDLMLIHKPKRPSPDAREGRYANLIAEMKRDEIYQALPSGVGPVRVLKSVSASIVLPFTSIGDVALDMKKPAAYFDAKGGISNPEQHAQGLIVLSGKAELSQWLAKVFEMPNLQQTKAS